MNEPPDLPSTGDIPLEEFRRSAHELTDWISRFLEEIDRIPVSPQFRPGDVRRRLPAAPPRRAEPMSQILADVDRVVMPGMVHWNHPSFFAYFTSSGSGPGILGEFLSADRHVETVKSVLERELGRLRDNPSGGPPV